MGDIRWSEFILERRLSGSEKHLLLHWSTIVRESEEDEGVNVIDSRKAGRSERKMR